MARVAGFDVSDRRSAHRFCDAGALSRYAGGRAMAGRGARRDAASTATPRSVSLTHDPKIDDPALEIALRAECFYIGALGSRKTHAKRLERMRAKGFDEAALARIHAPIGLDIGAVSPAEIAVSIIGEIVASLRKKPLRSETATSERGVKFGPVPLAEAEGAILAHAVRLDGPGAEKGRRRHARSPEALAEAGVASVIAARLQPGDVERERGRAPARPAPDGRKSARRAALHRPRQYVRPESRPRRSSIARRSTASTAVDEAITVATLAPFAAVAAGDMVATVKIIPFAAPAAALAAAMAKIGSRRRGLRRALPAAAGSASSRRCCRA